MAIKKQGCIVDVFVDCSSEDYRVNKCKSYEYIYICGPVLLEDMLVRLADG